jgi:lipopolysaccharide transport system permease protein
MTNSFFLSAVRDIIGAVGRLSLVATLGWQDVRQRYRRSAVGAFWLTISMGVVIGTIGTVFGQIFKSPMEQFLPFLSVGLIIWGFISAVITEGCTGFIMADAVIKQLPIPLSVHILRLIWRNLIILAHNIVIFPLVLLAVQKPIGWVAFLSIPGLVLLIANLIWIALLLATICARYRDIPQIVSSALQIVFYLTPIMWLPHLLPQRASLYIVDANPFFHLIEIVRAPLLGSFPLLENWLVSLAMCIIGWVVTLAFYGRYRRRVAYWL